jgi:hypothetical protein
MSDGTIPPGFPLPRGGVGKEKTEISIIIIIILISVLKKLLSF